MNLDRSFLVLAALAISPALPCARAAHDPSPDPERLSQHTRVLASDEFAGRAPGTEGERKTVAYLIRQLKAAGVRGGAGRGAFVQEVPFQRFSLRPPGSTGSIELQIQGAAPGCPRSLGPDDVVLWTRRPAHLIDIRQAPLMFAGHGVVAPAQRWDDYAGTDLRGKIAVLLANDPDHEAASGPFGGPAMAYVGRVGYKMEVAARRGALAVLVINHPKASGHPWPFVRSAFAAPTLDIARPGLQRPALEGWLRQEAAERLFRCAGRELEPLRKAAAQASFRALPLDLRFSARIAVQVETSRTQNVIGVLPGSERPREAFLYTAHWDHLGRGKPDSAGDDIYNGALDNAVGVAGLLELARLFGAAPRPRRSLVFIATTLEENGLLGAEYYAAHPPLPLELTAGGINMDAMNVFGPTPTMEVTGLGKTTLEDLLGEELQRRGRRMQQDPNSVVGFYYRSDHFPFVKRGVPFLFCGSGWEMAEARFPNRRDPQVGTRYHQPSDEWSADMDFGAAAQDLQVYYAVGRRVADSDTWPGWRGGAEFQTERAASEAQRRSSGK